MGVDREEELQGSECGIDVLMRRDVDLSDFLGEDKENLCVFVDYAAESLQQRSPLPVGYPRSPLQDITDVLSSMNQSAEVDECGGYRIHKERGNQKKTSLQQQLCCLPIGDSEGASSQMRHSEQSTVMESLEAAGPRGWIDAPLLPRLLCSKVPEKSKETSLCKLVTKQKGPEKELDTGLVAATLHQRRRIVARRPSLTVDSSCAEPSSPSSQRSKRRKALAKLIPGQKVPRFQSTASSGLFNHPSKTSVVWIMKQNECA
ncbi:unnamed protein product [Sphagnum jensenii]|uniref:Uncharacterized protein n=1 Tax=Sphagnum jensenii TaxID=128206 RepID=A0ABP1AZS2_9BRYO